MLLTTASLAPSSSYWSYAPSFISSYGYPPLQSNALASIGNWLLVVISKFLKVFANYPDQ